VVAGAEGFFLYHHEGVYRLDAEGLVALVYAFGRGSGTGNRVPWADGGVLIVHPDLRGARLLAFDAAGNLAWERALRGGAGRLVRVADRVFLLAEASQASAGVLHLFEVDMVNQALIELLVGGTRTSARGLTWIEGLHPAQVVIQVGGGHLILFAPGE
jgi:hypothetical protein